MLLTFPPFHILSTFSYKAPEFLDTCFELQERGKGKKNPKAGIRTHLSSLFIPFWLLKMNGSLLNELPKMSSNLFSGRLWKTRRTLSAPSKARQSLHACVIPAQWWSVIGKVHLPQGLALQPSFQLGSQIGCVLQGWGGSES